MNITRGSKLPRSIIKDLLLDQARRCAEANLLGRKSNAEKEPYPNAPGDVRETGKGLVEKSAADAEKGEQGG